MPPNSFKFSETRASAAVLFILKENKTPVLKMLKVLVCTHRSYFYAFWWTTGLTAFAAWAGWLPYRCCTEGQTPRQNLQSKGLLVLCEVTDTERQVTGRKLEFSTPKDKANFFPSDRYMALFESPRLHECRWIESGLGAVNSEVSVSLWCDSPTAVECLLFFLFLHLLPVLRPPHTSPSLHRMLLFQPRFC